jgi:hypothetical protein
VANFSGDVVQVRSIRMMQSMIAKENAEFKHAVDVPIDNRANHVYNVDGQYVSGWGRAAEQY